MKTWMIRAAGVAAAVGVLAMGGGRAWAGEGAEENLALKKPVVVEGDSQGENVPAKAVDGVPTNESGWHSSKTPSRLRVDLGKSYTIDRVAVYTFYDAVRYYQYTVEASADGEAWKQVVDMSKNTAISTAGGSEHCFAPTAARYVRVTMLKNSANIGKHLNEVMVFEAGKAGAIELKYDRTVLLGGGTTLRFADSHAQAWDLKRTLLLRDWAAGKDHVVVGAGPGALTAEQLGRVGFANPSGKPAGLYKAAAGPDGELTPGAAVTAVNPPFDLSENARAGRAKVYEVHGLAHLTGKDSPLADGMTIDFFGDSITWLNSYIEDMNAAIKAGEGSKDKKVTLVNRGINGGGVLSVRDGSGGAAYPGDSKQAAFAAVIAADKAQVAVVFIGINDVWWRKTEPATFEQALRDIVASARANKTTPVLATMTVHGERPDGKNADDAKIEQFSDITRKVARDTGTTLVDLRKAYVAYLQNHNAALGIDGSLAIAESGILTYDGVHPNAAGAGLLADLIADGVYRALKR
ncbi:MAG: GDSL-type esterase/lipase family protein [Planctomycetota bacterium]|nr:GDSL-type esterase/lipase family protein [Planctomycetota bacterium]